MGTEPGRLPLETEFLFRIDIETKGVQALGPTPWGGYVAVPVTGGTVTGPRVNGTVLNAFGDWSTTSVQKTEACEYSFGSLDCRLLIRVDDSDADARELKCQPVIEMSYHGISYYRAGVSTEMDADGNTYAQGQVMDASGYYFRTAPRFRTSLPKYLFLNTTVAVATGYHRYHAGPIYDVYAVR